MGIDMNLEKYLKSVIEADTAPIVLCDLNHIVIYMNKAAINRYANRGGNKLIGESLLNCHNNDSNNKIQKTIEWFKQDINNNVIHESYNEKENKDVYIIALRDDNNELIGYYEKHEYRNIDTSEFYDFK